MAFVFNQHPKDTPRFSRHWKSRIKLLAFAQNNKQSLQKMAVSIPSRILAEM